MQNIKPLQTNKPRIMSNKEAMEELERYKPPKEEPKENKPQTIDERINEELVPYQKFFKISKQECEAMLGLERVIGPEPVINFLIHSDFGIIIKNNQVTSLVINRKNLKEIPEQINKLTNLEILNLSDNKITSIQNLNKLTNLKELYLSSNPIQEIEGLGYLTNLQTLFLCNNNTKLNLNLDKLTNLHRVYFNSNPIILYPKEPKEFMCI